MLKPLFKLIALLIVLSIILMWVTLVKERAAHEKRTLDSTFVALLENKQIELADIQQVGVSLPGDAGQWHYVRGQYGWRIPEFRNAYALSGAIEGLIKALLNSRARYAASMPADATRYGLVAGQTLTLILTGQNGTLMQVQLGRVIPGSHDECYTTRPNDPYIYLLNINPHAFFPAGESPPLLDRRVMPQAVPQGSPSRITFAGSQLMDLRAIEVVVIPIDPEVRSREREHKPTRQFYGFYHDGREALLDDKEASPYLNNLLNMSFDDIIGDTTPALNEYHRFSQPALEITLYSGDISGTTLLLSSVEQDNMRGLLNKATGQMFLINVEKAGSLFPRIKAAD
jgi:hypothetical protein